MKFNVHQTCLELVQGDITELQVDAIVNAANSQLILGGGVAGAIRDKGGSEIQLACERHGPIQVGQAAITTGGHLKANYVIHAVGPRMGEGDEDNKLKNATLSTLVLADRHHLSSIGFCAISTGIFGFPLQRCAEIMLAQTIDYLNGTTGLKKVIFCLYDSAALAVFDHSLKQLTC